MSVMSKKEGAVLKKQERKKKKLLEMDAYLADKVAELVD